MKTIIDIKLPFELKDGKLFRVVERGIKN